MTHVGFTGTQQGMTDTQCHTVRRLVMDFCSTDFHHGDCIGADDQADDVARFLGCQIHIHPPTNDKKRAFCCDRRDVGEYDMVRIPKPYLERNRNIVDATETLIAAPFEVAEQTRSGTWSTVRYARKMGKPVYVVLPDGTVQQ